MYEEKYVRRGEIYSVRYDNVLPGEMAGTRPGLLISGNTGNSSSPTVIVAYLTTQDHNIGIHYGPTKATGRPSYIQCEQIYTVNKQRLGRLMGSLSESEMREVENRLDTVLDLGWVDDAPLKEKEQTINALKLQLEELKSEVLRLRTSLSAKEDEILTRDVEIAVHKRMYEKAVGIIAAMKVEPDLPKPPKYVQEIEQTKKVEETPKPPKNPKPPKPKEEPKLVDINTATFSQLRGIGLSNSLVLSVINDRPYKKVEDLKKVPGLNNKIYGIVEKKVCCIPVPEEPPKVEESKVEENPPVEETPVVVVEEKAQKANLNQCTASDLVAVGIKKWHADRIVKYRDGHGNFEKLEDVLNIDKVTPAWLSMYRDNLEV